MPCPCSNINAWTLQTSGFACPELNGTFTLLPTSAVGADCAWFFLSGSINILLEFLTGSQTWQLNLSNDSNTSQLQYTAGSLSCNSGPSSLIFANKFGPSNCNLGQAPQNVKVWPVFGCCPCGFVPPPAPPCTICSTNATGRFQCCNCDAMTVGPCFKYDGSLDGWTGGCAAFGGTPPFILSPVYVPNTFVGSQCLWDCQTSNGVSVELRQIVNTPNWRFRLSLDGFVTFVEYTASGGQWACNGGGQMNLTANTIGCSNPPQSINVFAVPGPPGYALCGRTLCDATMPSTLHGTFQAPQCPDLDGVGVILTDNGFQFPQRVWSGTGLFKRASQKTGNQQFIIGLLYQGYPNGQFTCYGYSLTWIPFPAIPSCGFAFPFQLADDCISLSCTPLVIKFLNFTVNTDPSDPGRQCPSCFTGSLTNIDAFIVTI